MLNTLSLFFQLFHYFCRIQQKLSVKLLEFWYSHSISSRNLANHGFRSSRIKILWLMSHIKQVIGSVEILSNFLFTFLHHSKWYILHLESAITSSSYDDLLAQICFYSWFSFNFLFFQRNAGIFFSFYFLVITFNSLYNYNMYH